MLTKEINLEKDIEKILKFDEEELNKISKEEVERVKEKKGRTKSLISDVIFKSVFINEPDILIKMIKDIFNINEDINNPIVISGYESVPIVHNGKTFKNDLLVRLADNSYVVIEMNNKSNKGVLDRNLIQLFRVHSQILNKGEEYKNLEKYRIRGLNFNYGIRKENEIDEYAFCNIKTGEIASNIITYVSVDVEKCIKLVYNNIRKKEDLPLSVIWASIMNEEDISKIRSRLRGILTMEQIDRLSKRIEDVNDDEKVMKQWMIEDNSRWYFEEIKEDGFQEGMEKGIETTTTNMIKNMLNKNTDYEYISEITGKTIEEIKEIEETIK